MDVFLEAGRYSMMIPLVVREGDRVVVTPRGGMWRGVNTFGDHARGEQWIANLRREEEDDASGSDDGE